MGLLLILPFFLIRFGLLSRLSPGAVRQAARFAPLLGRERAAYWLYQGSNAAIFLSMPFLRVKAAPPAPLWAGAILYCAGTLLLVGSVVAFAAPSEDGLRQKGLYRWSRNPMYVAYFVLFLSYALLTQSLLLLGLVATFQITAHWIIRSEERWCAARFGDAYLQYMRRVRRYL